MAIKTGDYIRYKESAYTGVTKINRVSYVKDEGGKLTYKLSDDTETTDPYIISFGSLMDVLQAGDLVITCYDTVKQVEKITNNCCQLYSDFHLIFEDSATKYIRSILTKEQVGHYAYKL